MTKYTREYELKYYGVSMIPVKVMADSLVEAQIKFIILNSPEITYLTPRLLDSIIEV